MTHPHPGPSPAARRPLRRALSAAVAGVLMPAVLLTVPAQARAPQAAPGTRQEYEYVVLYREPADGAAARRAIAAAGGEIRRENTAVGLATVVAANADLIPVLAAHPAIAGVARNRSIGSVPRPSAGAPAARHRTGEARTVEQEGRADRRAPAAPQRGSRGGLTEPLAALQWDNQAINATATGSYRVEQGDRRVLVGVMDTGVDGSHPDIAPNFDRRLSRNFTVDIPVDANGDPVDGPCEEEPDRSCTDPPDVDENEHGTHVASAIASPINGLGVAGVAPKVRIVNLRVGQDSGYFFLQPTVDALTYAADHGIDVVNMSYYIDPWLFNCTDNPADSPEDRLEQATIIKAVQRALDYAHRHNVTLIAAAGNQGMDYTKENTDSSSPDFASTPGEAPYPRTVPPSCLSLPAEGDHVITVGATGPSGRKAYYANFGAGFIDVAAPGGDVYDTPSGELDRTKGTLSAYPESLARARGQLNADGTPNTPQVVRDCTAAGVCAYYQYLQGTSMAAPRVAGVAALIVSRYGRPDRHGGLTLEPATVARILKGSATVTPCPAGGAYTYTRRVPQPDGTTRTVTATHACEGPATGNGFYGAGRVDALRAVSGGH